MKSITNFARLTVLGLLSALFIVFVPGTASACSCMPVTAQQMIDESQTVFVGEEIGRQRVDGEPGIGTVAVTFQVIEAYKGEVTSEMVLLTADNSAACGVDPIAGPIGITTNAGDELWYALCGSVHDAGEIAAVLDPIDLVDDEPIAAPPTSGDSGDIAPAVWIAGGGFALAAVGLGLAVARRRRGDWQDGWMTQS